RGVDPLRLPGPRRLPEGPPQGRRARARTRAVRRRRGRAARRPQARPRRVATLAVPRGRAPRPLRPPPRARARGNPGPRQGRQPRPEPLEKNARAPLPLGPRGTPRFHQGLAAEPVSGGLIGFQIPDLWISDSSRLCPDPPTALWDL